MRSQVRSVRNRREPGRRSLGHFLPRLTTHDSRLTIMLTRAALGLVWLLRLLPLALLALLGRGVGFLLYLLGRERREVVLTNIRLVLPAVERSRARRIGRAHFQAFGRSLLEHGILWWSSKERVQRLVRIEGIEHWQAVRGQPVIWLAPHFVGLDMGGIRIGYRVPRASRSTASQKNPVFDARALPRPHPLRDARAVFAPGGRALGGQGAAPRAAVLLPARHGFRRARLDLRAVFRRARGDHHRAVAASPGSPAPWWCRR